MEDILKLQVESLTQQLEQARKHLNYPANTETNTFQNLNAILTWIARDSDTDLPDTWASWTPDQCDAWYKTARRAIVTRAMAEDRSRKAAVDAE